MTCHWMRGTQESTPCPLCCLMYLCWEPVICAEWSANDFHHLRKKYDVPSMWGNIHPQWRLLQQHLDTKGPGWYPPSEREERLFTNRSNRPKDDMKDELRTDGDPIAWRIWSTAQNQLWQLRQPAPPLEFPGEQGLFTDMYAQVRGGRTKVISLQFTCGQQDVSKRRRRKRKQVDDGYGYCVATHCIGLWLISCWRRCESRGL